MVTRLLLLGSLSLEELSSVPELFQVPTFDFKIRQDDYLMIHVMGGFRVKGASYTANFEYSPKRDGLMDTYRINENATNVNCKIPSGGYMGVHCTGLSNFLHLKICMIKLGEKEENLKPHETLHLGDSPMALSYGLGTFREIRREINL